MTVVLREILAFGPGEHQFRKANYPWLAALRIAGQSGQGGASAEGNPGSPGRFLYKELPLDELPDLVEVVVGAGGRGGPYVDPVTGVKRAGQKGDDGLVLLELYADE